MLQQRLLSEAVSGGLQRAAVDGYDEYVHGMREHPEWIVESKP
jgi:hypothetical protein